jgi:hypothetical protein
MKGSRGTKSEQAGLTRIQLCAIMALLSIAVIEATLWVQTTYGAPLPDKACKKTIKCWNPPCFPGNNCEYCPKNAWNQQCQDSTGATCEPLNPDPLGCGLKMESNCDWFGVCSGGVQKNIQCPRYRCK